MMSTTKSISLNEMKDKLPIKTFVLSQFVTDPAIIMITKRGSGISWIVRDTENEIK